MKRLTIVLFIFPTFGFAQNIETIWRARGIEAEGYLNKKSPKVSNTSDEYCKGQIEVSFALFSKPDSVNIQRRPEKPSEFQISLYLKSSSGKAVNLVFVYDEGATTPKVILPMFYEALSKEGWGLLIFPSEPAGSFVLQSPECAYFFNPKDYLHPTVKNVRTK